MKIIVVFKNKSKEELIIPGSFFSGNRTLNGVCTVCDEWVALQHIARCQAYLFHADKPFLTDYTHTQPQLLPQRVWEKGKHSYCRMGVIVALLHKACACSVCGCNSIPALCMCSSFVLVSLSVLLLEKKVSLPCYN